MLERKNMTNALRNQNGTRLGPNCNTLIWSQFKWESNSQILKLQSSFTLTSKNDLSLDVSLLALHALTTQVCVETLGGGGSRAVKHAKNGLVTGPIGVDLRLYSANTTCGGTLISNESSAKKQP